MDSLILVDGQSFPLSIERFSLAGYSHCIQRMVELQKLAVFPRLKSASFVDTNLDDVGLEYVSKVRTLEHLDLQDTKITNAGLAHLAQLPRLDWLRLKENSQLNNECVPHLQRLERLSNLQIHETSIDQKGLEQLADMQSLRDICIDVWRDNYTFEGLLALSVRMPNCTILAKGQGTFHRGRFEGKW